MRRIWTVARYTLAQCLRAKLAVAFIVVLAAALVLLSMTLKGDGTLSGRIRTFLSYGALTTNVVLSLATVLLSVSLVSGDVRSKQVFLLSVKPVARWQYILGRWLGVVMLDAIILIVVGGIIYVTAQHLRTQDALNRQDRQAIETEVFSSRAKIQPVPPLQEQERRFKEEIARLGPEGYKSALGDYLKKTGGDEAAARHAVESEIRKRVQEGMQSAGPGQWLKWDFSGVHPEGAAASGAGRVVARQVEYRFLIGISDEVVQRLQDGQITRFTLEGVPVTPTGLQSESVEVRVLPSAQGVEVLDRLITGSSTSFEVVMRTGGVVRAEGKLVDRSRHMLVRLDVEPRLADLLTVGVYVGVDGVDARVERLDGNSADVRFFDSDVPRGEVAALQPQKPVGLTLQASVQLSYKITATGTNEYDPPVSGAWAAGRPSGGVPPAVYAREDPSRIRSRWSIPNKLVGTDGGLVVVYQNRSPTVVTILSEDVSLFYRVGAFEWNFIRAMLLILVQMMFLAAVGVCAGSFLAFPIGVLACMTLLPFSAARSFLDDAVKISGKSYVDPMIWFGNGVMHVMRTLLPDFAATSPSQLLVDGVHIGWGDLGLTAAVVLGAQAGAALLAACVIFTKRELARVQV